MFANLTLQVAQADAPTKPKPIYPEGLPEHKYHAYDLVLNTWDESQWEYFDDLVNRESNWETEAQNPHSTAFGKYQFLNSTWSIVNCKKTTDPKQQDICGVRYIKKVYGTPRQAILFHNQHNWY